MSDDANFDLRDVAERHIYSIDKLYRMHAGLSSDLISYEDGIIELEIRVTKRWPKSHEVTALQLADCWRGQPELDQAKGCLVHIYDVQKPVGSSVPVHKGSAEGPAREEWMSSFVQAMKAMAEPRTDVLAATIRGEFTGEPDEG